MDLSDPSNFKVKKISSISETETNIYTMTFTIIEY